MSAKACQMRAAVAALRPRRTAIERAAIERAAAGGKELQRFDDHAFDLVVADLARGPGPGLVQQAFQAICLESASATCRQLPG